MSFDRDAFDEALTIELAVLRYAPHASAAALELSELADDRALDGPVETDGRCFLTEAREELADARNYLVWEHRRLRALDQPVAHRSAVLERALAALAVAWLELSDEALLDPDAGCVGGDVEQRPAGFSLVPPGADRPRAMFGTSRGARADRGPQ